MIVLDSARKHGIPDNDIFAVIANPHVIAELREDPEKLLFLGFDSKARAIEIITDTGASGQVFVIHADLITLKYETILAEVL
jgi:sulfur transfer complex TusBCD TusB component (DsrH family)